MKPVPENRYVFIGGPHPTARETPAATESRDDLGLTFSSLPSRLAVDVTEWQPNHGGREGLTVHFANGQSLAPTCQQVVIDIFSLGDGAGYIYACWRGP